MPEQGREGRAERRALVADLVRTQAVLQARSEQLQRIFASRWYRVARFGWRLRHGKVLARGEPPRMAGEDSFARPLDSRTAQLDKPQLPPGQPIPGLESGPRPRLLFAGHSLSFCRPIAERALRLGAAVREDRWRTHGDHANEASAAALDWADIVHCEWCLGNAAWYSRNKRPGQRLVVRFHRMELETGYPAALDLERVDAMVFVARHVLERACERFGWDSEDPRFVVLPNGIETETLAQPKSPGAEHSLAVVGYVPKLKRLDRALDLLELLRARDERYRLLVKGREPWEHGWMAGREEERQYYAALAERLERTPALRDAVEFEPFGDDVAEFLRRAGWIVSTSEVEGHSVAVAEGMASGAVPVVLDRPGAAEQYEAEWIHTAAAAAAEAILTTQDADRRESQGELARRLAGQCDWQRLWPQWDQLLLGGKEEARADRHVRLQPLHH